MVIVHTKDGHSQLHVVNDRAISRIIKKIMTLFQYILLTSFYETSTTCDRDSTLVLKCQHYIIQTTN